MSLPFACRAHRGLVGRLELQLAEREQRRIGERERKAQLDLLLPLGLESQLVGDLAQRRELRLGHLVHRLEMQRIEPRTARQVGPLRARLLPLAKDEAQEIIATVPGGGV